VRRGRLGVPAVAGGAYERGTSKTSRICVETLEARAKLAPGTRRPASTDWSPRRTLTTAMRSTDWSPRRTLTAALRSTDWSPRRTLTAAMRSTDSDPAPHADGCQALTERGDVSSGRLLSDRRVQLRR